MAKQLSNKVEHCPSCGKLKSKAVPCKHCGNSACSEIETKINLRLTGYDMSKYTCVVINGVEYRR
jgi:hypothetical protein